MNDWRAIQRYPFYEVSSKGQVRRVKAAKGCRAGRVLKPNLSAKYPTVTLGDGTGARATCQVHQLVASAFLPPRPSRMHQLAHWDGDPQNAAAKNLRWATRSENEADKKRHGTHLFGARVGNARLTDKSVENAKRLREMGWSYRNIASAVGVSTMTIYAAINAQTWRHISRNGTKHLRGPNATPSPAEVEAEAVLAAAVAAPEASARPETEEE